MRNYIYRKRRRKSGQAANGQPLGNIVCTVIAILLLWILMSWADVLFHNAPRYGDGKYHPYNIIVMFAEAAKK